MFYALFVCGNYFVNMGLSKSAFSTNFFLGGTSFFSVSVLCCFFVSLVLNSMSCLLNYSIMVTVFIYNQYLCKCRL